ncbi:MAG: TraE/TraK family type IV conjugative transfer system protein [Mariprofundales bacterium]
MNQDKFKGVMAGAVVEVRYLRIALLVALLITSVSLILLLTKSSEYTVEVVVPNPITQDFWVSNHGFSEQYLRQMTTFISYLWLNASPATLAYQKNELLQYVIPEAHSQIQTDLDAQLVRFKKSNVSTSFQPVQIKVDVKTGRAGVRGSLYTYVAGKQTSVRQVIARILYQNRNGRFYVEKLELLDVNSGNHNLLGSNTSDS